MMIIFAVFPSKMRLYVRGLAAATVAAACGLGVLSGSAEATTYTFETLNNAVDPTFNQLLGINSSGLISGYFGSGAGDHPNKGYLLAPLMDRWITKTRTSQVRLRPRSPV
jgi:hypothetical protein